MGKRTEREKMAIQRMIALYQRCYPRTLADNTHYQALDAYADKRLDKCVFGENRPACEQCLVHCCQSAKRGEMKQIMRWAGPRVFRHHPILTARHLLDDRHPVPALPEKYQPKKQRPSPGQRGAQPGDKSAPVRD